MGQSVLYCRQVTVSSLNTGAPEWGNPAQMVGPLPSTKERRPSHELSGPNTNLPGL